MNRDFEEEKSKGFGGEDEKEREIEDEECDEPSVHEPVSDMCSLMKIKNLKKKRGQTFISDEDVARYENMQRRDKEYVHGQLGVEAAHIQGIFLNSETSWEVKEEGGVEKATEYTDATVQAWRQQMEQSPVFSNDC